MGGERTCAIIDFIINYSITCIITPLMAAISAMSTVPTADSPFDHVGRRTDFGPHCIMVILEDSFESVGQALIFRSYARVSHVRLDISYGYRLITAGQRCASMGCQDRWKIGSKSRSSTAMAAY